MCAKLEEIKSRLDSMKVEYSTRVSRDECGSVFHTLELKPRQGEDSRNRGVIVVSELKPSKLRKNSSTRVTCYLYVGQPPIREQAKIFVRPARMFDSIGTWL